MELEDSMHQLLMGMIACTLLSNSHDIAQKDSARAIIERAIEAQGGAQKVVMLRCMRIKVEGTTNFVPSQPNLPFTIEDIWQMPDKYKTTSIISFMGQKHVQTEVIDGSRGWSRSDGAVQDMPPDALREMKEQKYAEDLDRLAVVGEKGIQISALDEA